MQDLSSHSPAGHTCCHVMDNGLILPDLVYHCKPSLRYQPAQSFENLTWPTYPDTQMTNDRLNLEMTVSQVVSRQVGGMHGLSMYVYPGMAFHDVTHSPHTCITWVTKETLYYIFPSVAHWQAVMP